MNMMLSLPPDITLFPLLLPLVPDARSIVVSCGACKTILGILPDAKDN
jgi:hypothetical protein